MCSQPPNVLIPDTTIPISAGEGPFMDTFPLRMNDVKIPPIIAAKSPASNALGGKFMAIAIPSESGRATSETLKPASTSFLQYCLKSIKIFFLCANLCQLRGLI